MKIEQLTLENFKCFKTEKTFDFSRLTILTGANSSGKSSVIHAILMALQSEGFPSSLSPNGSYIRLGDYKEIVNQHDSNKVIQLGFKFRNQRINSNQLIKTYWNQDEISQLPKSLKLEVVDNDTFYGLKYLSGGMGMLLHTSNYISSFRKAPQRTYYEQNQRNYKVGTEGEEYIDQIVEWDKRSNGKIKELLSIMKELDLIEDIKIKRLGGGRFEVSIKPVGNKEFSALNDVGSGVSAFMPIIVADIQLPDNSTLFIAEPENHLHPSAQSKYGDYIFDKINNSDKNYVIETHSEYFLNKIRLAIVKGELKKEDVKVYFLENNGDDTDVFDIDFTKTGAIKNAPPNFFRTYFLDTMDIALNSFAE
jgi:predicted ATPase